MQKNFIGFGLLVVILIFSFLGMSLAQQQKYIEYTVKKGDTLWDISGINLTDPFLWPKVWKENPHIKNPDLIYPGQKIKIPLEVLQKQIELPLEQEKAKEAVVAKKAPVKAEPEKKAIRIHPKEVPVVEAYAIASAGYISKEIPEVARILSNPEGRTILAQYDTAYIKVLKGKPTPGRLFYSIRPIAEVEHPETGEDMGYIIEITGILKIVGQEAGYTKAEVLKSFSEINIGDKLDEYYDIEPVPLIYTKGPEVHGTIVAARHMKTITGRLDVVYLDRGAKDGLKPGDVLTIISSTPPKRPIGQVQILETKDTTSTAMIINSQIEIRTGDFF
jgi:LysM repeat protein